MMPRNHSYQIQNTGQAEHFKQIIIWFLISLHFRFCFDQEADTVALSRLLLAKDPRKVVFEAKMFLKTLAENISHFKLSTKGTSSFWILNELVSRANLYT